MKAISSLLLVIALAGCKGGGSATETGADIAVSAGVAGLSSAIGMLATSGNGIALRHEPGTALPWETRLAQWLFPTSFATVTSCQGYAVGDTCSNGIKQASYSSCPLGNTGNTFSGTVTLTYSRVATCVLGTTGETVTRTTDLSRGAAFGSKIQSTSETRTDYRGISIGGGAQMIRNSTNYALDLAGIHKIKRSSGGDTIFDVSMRTTNLLNLSDPTVSPISVSSGTLEVVHNTGKWVATLATTGLTYNYGTCCYPTSGSISVSYTGSVKQTGTITFDGECGTANYSDGTNSTSVALLGCE
jgi:hypothetical protein